MYDLQIIGTSHEPRQGAEFFAKRIILAGKMLVK